MMQPQWRYVPFASTLLMGSGVFMLLHGAPEQPVRAFSSHACESASAPATSGSMPGTPSGEHVAASPDDRGDAAKVSIAPSTQGAVDSGRSDDAIEADTARWPPPRSAVLWLRGPPSVDEGAPAGHRFGTGPVDSSFDAFDDDDDGDDDTDTDDGDGLATQVTASASVSCALHPTSVLSRVTVHHPVSFASDVQSLRAPPQ
jgi:hypothetical protein